MGFGKKLKKSVGRIARNKMRTKLPGIGLNMRGRSKSSINMTEMRAKAAEQQKPTAAKKAPGKKSKKGYGVGKMGGRKG